MKALQPKNLLPTEYATSQNSLMVYLHICKWKSFLKDEWNIFELLEHFWTIGTLHYGWYIFESLNSCYKSTLRDTDLGSL